ncbi:class I glutamine amidotransferase-like protein [Mycena floridula]|nr:class I glutamine amidotransferase-like protein [Mycena floridula]
MPSILFVFTSADKTLLGKPTGYYLPEAAHPYYVFSPTCEIDFASPKGTFPIDPSSTEGYRSDQQCIDFLKDQTVARKFSEAKKLSDVDADKYDVIFYPGGHGPVLDLPQDQLSIKLAENFYRSGKIIAAVCHGTAALAGVTDAQGKSIFIGKKFTGFSNAEEEASGLVKAIPFLLEDKISDLGGKYEKADDLWGVKVVVDGNLYTGQNPASARPLAEAILAALNK